MATNDGKIYITISDRRFGKNKAEADEQNKQDKEQDKKDNAVAKFAQHKFFNLIESQTKQAINYTISNIGNFTGDYIAQKQVQMGLNFVSGIVSVGMSAYAGFKMTGSLIGAAVAASVDVISKGITTAEQLYAGYVENVKVNRNIYQLRTRAGLNSANNGSRGTDQ